ncbi:NUDIX hydrolase [Parafrigoribacterium humi]|uniref:NUDIX hydrolase n=1 Tax=Parafrigoribacterium humi TaxID=3144664 RepID=UPI0032EE1EF1
MTLLMPSVVLAAGAVCWRLHRGTVEVLLVHRDERSDVSLPKGKVDPGETPPQTAVREIREETGLRVTLGPPLGTTEYTLPGGREKRVFYWSAEVDDETLAASAFTPNKEIAALEWLPIAAARKKMSYDRDQDVLDRFSARVDAGQLHTFAIIALRHGKAVPPASWDGPDATRPLLHKGTQQAASVAPAIAAWGPKRLVSSPAVRCVSTITPVADITGLEVKHSPGISQDAYEDGKATVKKAVAKRLDKQQTVVMCSHGPVLPGIIGAVARSTHTEVDAAMRRAAMLSTGHFTVLHVSVEHPKSGLVAIETHGPLVD